MPTPAPDEIPVRAQCGYVIRYSRGELDELTPAMVVGKLAALGTIDDLEETAEVAASVLAARRGDDDE